jgi:hypothetical protein
LRLGAQPPAAHRVSRSTTDRRRIYTSVVVSQAKNTRVRSAYGRLDDAYNSGILQRDSRPLIASSTLESQDIIPESFDLGHGSHGVILGTLGVLAPPLSLLPQRLLYLPRNVMNRQVSILYLCVVHHYFDDIVLQ